MATRVLIIHEVGEPAHYAGFIGAIGTDVKVRFIEFSTLLLMVRAFRKRSVKGFLKSITDFFYLFWLFIFPATISGRVVVFGIAPLDSRLFLLKRALSRAKVIYHTSWTSWNGSFYPKRSNSPALKRTWMDFLKTVPVIAAVTPAVRTQLMLHWGISPDKIVIVYHSYDPDMYYEDNNSVNRRDSGNVLRALFVGRLVEEKGVRKIMELAKRLPSVSFGIVGDGYLRDEVESYADQQGNFEYIGYLSDKKRLSEFYAAADIILLPSVRSSGWEELFGMALIEAMACGCIPICTDHTGPSMILEEPDVRAIGLIKEEEYVERSVEVIRILESSPVLRVSLSQKSKILASRYTKENISELWRKAIVICEIEAVHGG